MSFEARHEIINRLADVFKIYRNAESIKLEEQRRLRKFLQYEICRTSKLKYCCLFRGTCFTFLPSKVEDSIYVYKETINY